jgi:hypothetical protein
VIGLDVDIVRTQHGTSIATTNGSLTVNNTVMLSVEVKERKNPSRQNEVYVIQRSGISTGDHNEAVHKSAAHLAVEPHLPMLLIDIHDGVIISVRGAYFAPPSLVTSVLAVASMVADDISGPAHFYLTRVLCALRMSARTLYGRYSLVNTAIQTAAVMPDVVNSVQVTRSVQFEDRVAVCKRELMPRRMAFTAECDDLSVYNPDVCGTATIIKEGRWPAQFVLSMQGKSMESRSTWQLPMPGLPLLSWDTDFSPAASSALRWSCWIILERCMTARRHLVKKGRRPCISTAVSLVVMASCTATFALVM